MSSPLSTSSSAFAWRPDVTAFAPVDAVPEALILSASTVAGEVSGDEPSLRVAYVNDDSADFFPEATPIDESEPQLAECVVHTAKVAQLVAISNEGFANEGTAEQISQSVSRAIVARADQAFIAQSAPIGPAVAPPAGLLNVAGIEEGGVVYDNLDSLVDLIATLESNGAAPTHVILDPLGWAAVRKLKLASDSNASLVGAGTTDAAKMLLSLPVIVNRHVPAYSGVVLDRNAVVSAVGSVNVAVSEHAKFNSDSVVVRATWRIGWNVVRPDRVGKFTIDGDGS